MPLSTKTFANLYLFICTITFFVGMMLIEHPSEETMTFEETPMVITPGEQHFIFGPIEITAGE